MRAIAVASLLVVLGPVIAGAQAAQHAAAPAASPPAAAPHVHYHYRRGADITRDQYIARAKRNAERRFDRMDANHDGVLTEAERRAYRAAHHRKHTAHAEARKQGEKQRCPAT